MIKRDVSWKNKFVSIPLFAIAIICILGMKPVEQSDLEKWFYDDNSEDAVAKALAVNEGELEFLQKPPEKPPHELHNQFTISPGSLKDGWIDLVQCHENIDKVGAAEILYHPRRTKNLEVISSTGMERAWVEKNSVQMENITDNARVCVSAKVHSLFSNFDGSYSMHNGPFHRRFLDGYYPMRVTMDVQLPEGQLSFGAINPVEQTGFRVEHNSESIEVEALFVGELNIEVQFDSTTPKVGLVQTDLK